MLVALGAFVVAFIWVCVRLKGGGAAVLADCGTWAFIMFVLRREGGRQMVSWVVVRVNAGKTLCVGASVVVRLWCNTGDQGVAGVGILLFAC